MSRPQPVRRKLLVTLHGTGRIVERSGRATSLLAEAMGYTSRPVSLSPLLSVLEEDGLVRREVRGRRCFLIELTAKGRALIELDEGLESRRISPSDVGDEFVIAGHGAVATPSGAGRSDGAVAGGDGLDAASELLRRQLRDVLMEVGALSHRVSEIERQLASRAIRAPSEDRDATGGGIPITRRSRGR